MFYKFRKFLLWDAMNYWIKDIYSWRLFSAEFYPRGMSGFRMRHIFCCQVMWTLWTTSSGVAHTPSTVCKGHYTLPSALNASPSPNMASLDHSGSRTKTSGLWQSTASVLFRCLANSGQHLVDEEGSSWTSSGSSRMVSPPHLKRIIGMATVAFPWPTDQPQVWPVVVTTFTGLERPRFLSVGIHRTGCMATTPRLSLIWRQQSQ